MKAARSPFRQIFPVLLSGLMLGVAASPHAAAQDGVTGAVDEVARARQAQLAELEKRCRDFLVGEQQRIAFPGATLAFLLADGRSGAVAAGQSDVEAGTPMQPDDRMLSGSVGKMYVAATALLVAEQGWIDLDDPLSKWLGEEDWFERLPNHADIRLRQLLRHQSGVIEHVREPSFWADVQKQPGRIWKPAELVAYALDREALFPAGEGWSYADTNYILFAMAMERATGRPFYTELRERVLEPLKLNATAPSDRPRLPGLVAGYPVLMREQIGAPRKTLREGAMIMNPQLEWTGGGVYTTSRDLARWARALFHGELLEEGSLSQMLDGVPAQLSPGDRYGLGVVLWDSPYGPAVGHSGWFPGYLTEVAWFADHQLAVAVQFNTDDVRSVGNLRRYLNEAAAILLSREESQ